MRSGGTGIADISPRACANLALEDYDTNKDGSLDSEELQKCPALKAGMNRVDKNGDGRLTADELADRLKFLKDQGFTTSVMVDVRLDGRPLEGATVTLVPERFMGTGYQRASGVTDREGTTSLRREGSDDDGIPSGYYRVEVSKKDAKSVEQVPARYNTQTTLGHEVAPDARGRNAERIIELRLSRSGK
jgi:hypothetical protein